jgi:hypothetical protein
MGGPVVCYLNKYKIKSDNSTDTIQARHVKLRQFGYELGEIYNSREQWVRSANPIILISPLLWIS